MAGPKRICSIPNCGKRHYSRGWCRRHYGELRTGSPCSVSGCSKRSYGDNLCAGHFQRKKKYGDPHQDVPLGVNRQAQNVWGWMHDHTSYSSDDCLHWPFARNGGGYARISIKGASTTASRIMCKLAHGEPPTPEHEAAHSCGKGHEGCINPKHLRWATVTENTLDKIGHGTWPDGEKNGRAVLTPADVKSIRALRGKAYQSDIAAMLGVTQTTVSAIQRRKIWKDVE